MSKNCLTCKHVGPWRERILSNGDGLIKIRDGQCLYRPVLPDCFERPARQRIIDMQRQHSRVATVNQFGELGYIHNCPTYAPRESAPCPQ